MLQQRARVAAEDRTSSRIAGKTARPVWAGSTLCALVLSLQAVCGWSQAPSAGSAPNVIFGAFNVSSPLPCINLMQTAMGSSGLTRDYASVSAVIGHASNVSAAITCFSIHGNDDKRVVVFTVSTLPATTVWFRNDLGLRVRQAAAGKPASGIGGAAPTTGLGQPIQLGTFAQEDTIPSLMSKANYALYRADLRTGQKLQTELLGSNPRAGVVVAWASVGNDNKPRQFVSVFASSSVSATAEYYRNTVRASIVNARSY